jgi:hypothetical protein
MKRQIQYASKTSKMVWGGASLARLAFWVVGISVAVNTFLLRSYGQSQQARVTYLLQAVVEGAGQRGWQVERAELHEDFTGTIGIIRVANHTNISVDNAQFTASTMTAGVAVVFRYNLPKDGTLKPCRGLSDGEKCGRCTRGRPILIRQRSLADSSSIPWTGL